MSETRTQDPEAESGRQSAKILSLELHGGYDPVEHLASLKETPLKPVDIDAAQARMKVEEARRKLDEAMAGDPVAHGVAKIMDNPGQFHADDPIHERVARPNELGAARGAHKVRNPAGQHSAGQESIGRSMLKSLGRLVRRRKH